MVSTLLISTVFWLGGRSPAMHVSSTLIVSPVRQLPVIQMEPDIPVEIEEMARTKPTPVVAPILPQLQDVPRPVTPTSITQLIEPPHPESNMKDISVIRNLGPGGEGGKVWEFGSLDNPPSVTFQSPPHYPSSMIQSGMTGEVVVDFIVDTRGGVQNARAIRSSNREFESSAVEAVSKWKFRPGVKGGRPVFTHMQVPIEFSINRD